MMTEQNMVWCGSMTRKTKDGEIDEIERETTREVSQSFQYKRSELRFGGRIYIKSDTTPAAP
jgi:hypothetical protein